VQGNAVTFWAHVYLAHVHCTPERGRLQLAAGQPQGCFKIGVLRTPIWEAAVGDGFAGPPP
jgi:hypothetical protein